MPKFRVTDSQTGRSVVVSGSSAPSEAEAEEIFQSAGLREEQDRNLLSQVAELGKQVFPQSVKFAQNVAEYPETFRKAWDPNTPLQERGEFAVQKSKEILDQTNKTKLELAPYAVPLGSSVKTAVGLGAVAGGLTGASQDNATPLDVAVGAGAGAVTGGVLKGAGSVLGKAGKVIEEKGKNYVVKGLRPTDPQVRNFKKKTGIDLADFLNDNHVTGDFVQKSTDKLDELSEAFDDIAVSSKVKIGAPDVRSALTRHLDNLGLAASTDPSDVSRVGDSTEIVENVIKKYGESIDVSDLTKERRFYDKKVRDFASDPVLSSKYRIIRDALQDVIQETTENSGLPGLKEIGIAMRNFKQLKDLAESRVNPGRGHSPIPLSNLLGGILGTTAGMGSGDVGDTLKAGALGFVAPTVMRNPRVVAATSKALMKTGQSLQSSGGTKIEALRRALRNTAASQMSQKLLP